MTHLKQLGSWVRLPDGREGHVAGSTLDGYTVVIEGKIVIAKDVTAIPPPTPTDPPPIEPSPKNFRTCHEQPPQQQVVIPPGVSVMRKGQWCWPLGGS